jgi:polar amino acid transport system substrate-binding protein
MNKLEAYSPCGYSSAGEVIEVGEGTTGFAVGDLVACAGVGYANHAEVICVPTKLAVRLPSDADLRLASFNTLGAIALQGVRQAHLSIGESCVVIGLGLIGQLTCAILKSSGIRVIGIDVSAWPVSMADKGRCDRAYLRSTTGLEALIERDTDGLGADAVIITAGTSSLDPINLSGQIARKKGRVVVVGAVPTGFEREAYYQKELELVMSCSYGPGRYDPSYEEHGIDYPVAYVRWTENRNMMAFQSMLYKGSLAVSDLVTHEFPLEDGAKAYDLILEKEKSAMAVVIRYKLQVAPSQQAASVLSVGASPNAIGVAFIGAGSYAQSNLLPHFARSSDIVLTHVVTNSGVTSKRVAERFRFQGCLGDAGQVLGDARSDLLCIATRHDSHGKFVVAGLRAGKFVFVEKPLALTVDDLFNIEEAARASRRWLMVGYNRRFSKLAAKLKQRIGGRVMGMTYRINCGVIPANSWIHDKAVGGGRIVGEVCHFVDFMTFMCSSVPTEVFAYVVNDPKGLHDNVCMQLKFANGSVGSLQYFSGGSSEMPKERFEVFADGECAAIDDYRHMTIYGKKSEVHKLRNQDKGQAQMVEALLSAIKKGGGPPIAFLELRAVSLACFAVEESLREGCPIRVCS